MKNIQQQLIVFLLMLFTYPNLSYAQDSIPFEIAYEVNKVSPSFSITREKLTEAHTINDLNRYYKSSWIKEFISVEILTNHDGKTKKAKGKSDTLTQEQKDNMNTADVGTDISVSIYYIPDNNLKQNDPKEFDFTFKVDPENEAKYVGGAQQLNQYLKANVMDKIASNSFKQYNLSAVSFFIDEEGHVTDAHIHESTLYNSAVDEKINEVLLTTVCNMPKWTPAEYANGMKTKQEFVLTVGDHNSCTINLLNIRELPIED